MRDRPRRGCLGPAFLVFLGIALGLVAGVVLPEGGRAWVAGRLPRWLGGGGPVAVAPVPSPSPPPPSATPPALASATPTAPPAETPARALPDGPVIPTRSRELARLSNGLRVRTTLDAKPGQPASLERETPDSYALDLQLQIKVPTPMRTLPELSRRSPGLGAALPKLPVLLEKAEVSKFFFAVYQNKTDLLRQNLTRLDALLARDVFYDTDTILELQDPDSKRRALLIQTDLDVDTDGSDPERWNEVDTSDPTFQPMTNYKWPRRNPAVVSPLGKTYQERIDKLEADARTNPAARRAAGASLQTLREDLYAVEHYSSLIARNDPYVVLPSFMTHGGPAGYVPQVGDYVVVVAGNQLYPAIFGDKGPNHQLGEASVRVAQAIDPRATATRSPVDDLKITYLVFPGTAEQPFGPPDLGHIRQRCQELLNEIGGNHAELHEWASLLPPPPTPPPTPTPVPTATPVPFPAASPGVSPVPGLSSPPSSTPSPPLSPVRTASPSPASGASPARH